MTLISNNLRQRMAMIHKLLVKPPEESNLTHYEKQQLEDEYEELQLREKEACLPLTKPN